MYSTRLLFLICLVFAFVYIASAADQRETRRRRRGDRYSRKSRNHKSRSNRYSSKSTSSKAGTSKVATTTKSVTTTKATTTKTVVPSAESTSKASTTTKKSVTSTDLAQSAATSSSSSSSYSGEATYYNTGLGSCGWTNAESDMIVALNSAQMKNGANPNNNPMCGRHLTVKGPNGSVTVEIVDTCPTCASGDVDLSPAAFEKIAALSAGRVQVSWVFAD